MSFDRVPESNCGRGCSGAHFLSYTECQYTRQWVDTQLRQFTVKSFWSKHISSNAIRENHSISWIAVHHNHCTANWNPDVFYASRTRFTYDTIRMALLIVKKNQGLRRPQLLPRIRRQAVKQQRHMALPAVRTSGMLIKDN